jgi:hypothetical protein
MKPQPKLRKPKSVGPNIKERLRILENDIYDFKETIKSLKAAVVMDSSILQSLGMKIATLEKPVKVVKHHYPLTHKASLNCIYEVVCLCGEVTNYKVPLKTIDDFECPKERK